MFVSLAPQRVKHDSGYIVQTGGRYALQYIYRDVFAEVEADFATVTGVYSDTLFIRRGDGPPENPSPEERNLILTRILSALDFWGMKHEICSRK
jgi:hypothetical protein